MSALNISGFSEITSLVTGAAGLYYGVKAGDHTNSKIQSTSYENKSRLFAGISQGIQFVKIAGRFVGLNGEHSDDPVADLIAMGALGINISLLIPCLPPTIRIPLAVSSLLLSAADVFHTKTLYNEHQINFADLVLTVGFTTLFGFTTHDLESGLRELQGFTHQKWPSDILHLAPATPFSHTQGQVVFSGISRDAGSFAHTELSAAEREKTFIHPSYHASQWQMDPTGWKHPEVAQILPTIMTDPYRYFNNTLSNKSESSIYEIKEWILRTIHESYAPLPDPLVRQCELSIEARLRAYANLKPKQFDQWASDIKARKYMSIHEGHDPFTDDPQELAIRTMYGFIENHARFGERGLIASENFRFFSPPSDHLDDEAMKICLEGPFALKPALGVHEASRGREIHLVYTGDFYQKCFEPKANWPVIKGAEIVLGRVSVVRTLDSYKIFEIHGGPQLTHIFPAIDGKLSAKNILSLYPDIMEATTAHAVRLLRKEDPLATIRICRGERMHWFFLNQERFLPRYLSSSLARKPTIAEVRNPIEQEITIICDVLALPDTRADKAMYDNLLKRKKAVEKILENMNRQNRIAENLGFKLLKPEDPWYVLRSSDKILGLI